MNSVADIKLNDPTYVATMDKRGRIVLRKEMRERMDMLVGGAVSLHLDESGAVVVSPVKANHD